MIAGIEQQIKKHKSINRVKGHEAKQGSYNN